MYALTKRVEPRCVSSLLTGNCKEGFSILGERAAVGAQAYLEA